MFSYPHYGTSPASLGRDASYLVANHPNASSPPNSSLRQRRRRTSRLSDVETRSEVSSSCEDCNSAAIASDTEDEDDQHTPTRSTFTPASNALAIPGYGATGTPVITGMRPRAYSSISRTGGGDTMAQALSSAFSFDLPMGQAGGEGFEHTPLLGGQRGTCDAPAEDDSATRDSPREELKRELVLLAGYSIPIIGTHFLEYSLLVCTVVSVGHLGTVELAASSLASMTSNVAALSMIIGLCCGLDTLASQAATSPNPKLTSLFCLRTQFLLVILLIPQFCIFWNAEPILLALKQDPEVAAHASQYLRVMSFGLPGYGVFEVTRRWLQAQGLMSAPTYCLLIVAPLNVLLNYLLVWGPDSIRLGFVGAPMATMISFNLMGFLCVLYCIFYAPRTAWGGLSMDIFRDLGPNIRLGLAGFAMVASEWWCWEIVGLASSQLGPAALAAQSVCLTMCSLTYQLPYAVSAAAAVRCGNLLGAGNPRLAKVATYAALIAAVIGGAFNVTVMVAFKDKWGEVFSSEPEVISIVASVLPLCALFQVADGTSGITGGVLRGVGKASVGALINLTGYYVLGLPLGLFLTFSELQLGLYGLWIGLTIALTFGAICCTIYLLRLDYGIEAARARARMGYGAVDEDCEPDTNKPANGRNGNGTTTNA